MEDFKTLIAALNQAGAECENGLDHFMNDEEMYVKYLRQFPDEPSMGKTRAAFAVKDYAAAEKAVHALKGIAANLALIPVMDAAMEVLFDLRDGETDAAEEDLPELEEAYTQTVNVIKTWEASNG